MLTAFQIHHPTTATSTHGTSARKTTTEGNKGVVIKPWVWDHHAVYNLKDYYSYRHHQDADLVIDYRNSDLNFPTE